MLKVVSATNVTRVYATVHLPKRQLLQAAQKGPARLLKQGISQCAEGHNIY